MLIKLGRLVHQQRFYFAEETKTVKLNLYAPHLKKYFDNDYSKIDKQTKQIAKMYSLDQREIKRLFRIKPQIFIAQSEERVALEEKIKLLNKLEDQEPLSIIVNDLFFDSKSLVLNMTQQDILKFINYLKQFGFDEKAASSVFAVAPSLIHSKFDTIYQQKLTILKDYLQMNKKQALQLFVQEPFLLTCSTQRLRQSIVTLVQRQKSCKILTRQAIIKLLRDMGEVFLMGRQQITLLAKEFRNWDIPKEEVWATFLQHPLLLLNHPNQVLHLKKRIFKHFKFTLKMGQLLFRKYPSALICSVSALENKFLVARDRLKIGINENTLQFLTFKFGANIRPRAEMLIRGKISYTSDNILDFFRCTEEEFLQKTGLPKEKFLQQKLKYTITPQMDFPNKKCLKNYPSQKKIFEFSKRYYPKQDLVIEKKKK